MFGSYPVAAYAEEAQAANETQEVAEATVDKALLGQLIERASAVNAGLFTAESVAVLSQELTKAQALQVNSNATQVEIDVQTAALQSALGGLVATPNSAEGFSKVGAFQENEPGDTTALQALIDSTERIDEGLYTEESSSVFESVRAASIDMVEQASAAQETIDAQVSALQSALEGLTFASASARTDYDFAIKRATGKDAVSMMDVMS